VIFLYSRLVDDAWGLPVVFAMALAALAMRLLTWLDHLSRTAVVSLSE
jgi:hypothetical protein